VKNIESSVVLDDSDLRPLAEQFQSKRSKWFEVGANATCTRSLYKCRRALRACWASVGEAWKF